MNHHNKGRRLPPEPLSKEEILALMGACSRRCPTGMRDRALVCVLWRASIRISEALNLKPADFDREASTLRILHGKGDRSRVVALDAQACEVLIGWLNCRRSLGVNGGSPIFCTLAGGPISTAQIREMLPRRAKKAGIEKRVHAHALRHSGASDMASEGINLQVIQEQLGHASPSVTDRYLKRLNPVERIGILKERTW